MTGVIVDNEEVQLSACYAAFDPPPLGAYPNHPSRGKKGREKPGTDTAPPALEHYGDTLVIIAIHQTLTDIPTYYSHHPPLPPLLEPWGTGM